MGKLKRIAGMLLLVLGLSAVGLLHPLRVQAAPSLPKKVTEYFCPGDYFWYELDGVTDVAAVKSVKNSKKSVAAYRTEVKNGVVNLVLAPRKAGTTKITCKVKYKGKTRKLTMKFTAKKYVNPLKSLKLGKKKLTKKFDGSMYYSLGVKKTLKKQVIKVKPKEGWTLDRVTWFNAKGGYREYGNKDKITLKKGDTLNIWMADPNGVQVGLVIY